MVFNAVIIKPINQNEVLVYYGPSVQVNMWHLLMKLSEKAEVCYCWDDTNEYMYYNCVDL